MCSDGSSWPRPPAGSAGSRPDGSPGRSWRRTPRGQDAHRPHLTILGAVADMTHRSARIVSWRCRASAPRPAPGRACPRRHATGASGATCRGSIASQPLPVPPQQVQHEACGERRVHEAQTMASTGAAGGVLIATVAATAATPTARHQLQTASRRSDVARRYGSASRKGTNGATATHGRRGRRHQGHERHEGHQQHDHQPAREPGLPHESRSGHVPGHPHRRRRRRRGPARRAPGMRQRGQGHRLDRHTQVQPRHDRMVLRDETRRARIMADRCDGMRDEGVGLGPHEASRLPQSRTPGAAKSILPATRVIGHPPKVPVLVASPCSGPQRRRHSR